MSTRLTWYSLSFAPDPVSRSLQAAAIRRQEQARAPGTNRNHQTAAATYIVFCHHLGLDHLAPNHLQVCMYIEYLAQRYRCPATTKNNVAHMRQYMTLVGVPTQEAYHPRVKRALDALDRTTKYTPQVRPPV